jgi:4-methyl-5(b-hydroxyethyl)-thiazole monophosphate biosynthesis
MPGAEHLRDNAVLKQLLLRQRNEGLLYAAICAAPAVVLETHGLLDGRRATCHPGFKEKLGDPSYADRRVVRDTNCVTSQGAGTAMEFALTLVEVLFDEARCRTVAAPMLAVWP